MGKLLERISYIAYFKGVTNRLMEAIQSSGFSIIGEKENMKKEGEAYLSQISSHNTQLTKTINSNMGGPYDRQCMLFGPSSTELSGRALYNHQLGILSQNFNLLQESEKNYEKLANDYGLYEKWAGKLYCSVMICKARRKIPENVIAQLKAVADDVNWAQMLNKSNTEFTQKGTVLVNGKFTFDQALEICAILSANKMDGKISVTKISEVAHKTVPTRDEARRRIIGIGLAQIISLFVLFALLMLASSPDTASFIALVVMLAIIVVLFFLFSKFILSKVVDAVLKKLVTKHETTYVPAMSYMVLDAVYNDYASVMTQMITGLVTLSESTTRYDNKVRNTYCYLEKSKNNCEVIKYLYGKMQDGASLAQAQDMLENALRQEAHNKRMLAETQAHHKRVMEEEKRRTRLTEEMRDYAEETARNTRMMAYEAQETNAELRRCRASIQENTRAQSDVARAIRNL